ncbi:SusC/RagA family TonB-linked outer membrane protein [Sphingobacterium tabacisoli]|uniref:SusC/RagA family TonB-linked outer membrane protein n=1 Tax=Sphingobacterium tabacisoli TaxID=2044855 RepID=A0ABW5L9R9_9SPHI|nr:SusC/RagA family TonB-linked outer membrane protein [Sphingobacterium tabacisoli]
MYKNYAKRFGISYGYANKLMLIMRLTIVLLFFSMHLSARMVAQNVTLKGNNISLQLVFNQIRAQTGYDFVYNKALLSKAKPVVIDVKNKPLQEALNSCLEGQALVYTIQDQTIILREKREKSSTSSTDLNQRKVSGQVLNELGQPLVGASVRVVSNDVSTKTDENGSFSLVNIDDKATLEISYIGYKMVQVVINSTYLTIRLVPLTTELDAITVVNTGYQSISKERSVGSFAKPDQEILANRSTSMNVLQRLDGLVPGLTVNNSPGSESILIRGLNSINSSRSPLVVVDGIPTTSINTVNPQDVADITVLKDATAASIWGAKASNGVIVITTKRGNQSDKIRVNYDGFINFQGKPDLDYLPVLNSAQYIQAAREVFDPIVYPWNTASAYTLGAIGMPVHETILYNHHRGLITQAQANTSLDSLALINNRQQIKDLWFQNAMLMNHTISLSGGGKVHSFYGSASYTDSRSNRVDNKDNTYKVNLRQDFNFGPAFKAYLITDLTSSKGTSPRNVSVDSRFYPYQLFKDDAGTSLSMPYVGTLSDSTRRSVETRSRIGLDYKPLEDAQLANSDNNDLLNRVIGGFTITPLKSLRYEGVFGYIRGHNKRTLYDDNLSFVQRNELVQFTVAPTATSTPTYYLPVAGGKFSVGNVLHRDWTIRNQFIFDHSWNELLHQLTVLAGHEAQEQKMTLNQSVVRGYNPQLRNAIPIDYAALSLGIANPLVPNNLNRSVLVPDFYTETESQIRFNSYYANAAYTYNQKYAINASWRIDKSNLFGVEKGAQAKPVWSTGIKWNIHQENFMRDISVLDRLAFRSTYGVTGNSPIPGAASSYNILSSATSASLPGGRSYSVATAGNPSLTWERTKTANFGLDFAILKNRISGSVDYYYKKTDDLIGQLPVNSLTGFSVIVGNYGSLKNKGIEAVVNSVNISNPNFKWSTSLNLAYNKNEITDLKYLTPISTGQQMINQRYFSGYSAFALFAYPYGGLDQLGDPQITIADGGITKARNIARPDDMLYMGTTQPPISGGLSNTFSYKGFSLGINAVFNLGHVMRRDVGNFFSGRLIGTNALVRVAGNYNSSMDLTQGNINSVFLERWQQAGDENRTDVPSYISNTALSNSRRDINYYIYGNNNVLDASYIKVRDITLSYNLPQSILDLTKTKSVALRMQVSNLMLWKANSHGIDPEFQGFATSVATGGDPETIAGVTRGLRSMQGTVTLGAHVSF